MKIAYYPGCTMKTKAASLELAAVEALNVLGVEYIELERWNCCGAVFSLAEDDELHHLRHDADPGRAGKRRRRVDDHDVRLTADRVAVKRHRDELEGVVVVDDQTVDRLDVVHQELGDETQDEIIFHESSSSLRRRPAPRPSNSMTPTPAVKITVTSPRVSNPR